MYGIGGSGHGRIVSIVIQPGTDPVELHVEGMCRFVLVIRGNVVLYSDKALRTLRLRLFAVLKARLRTIQPHSLLHFTMWLSAVLDSKHDARHASLWLHLR